MAEYVIGLPDGAEYTIASEGELSQDELNAEVASIQRRHSETTQSTAASAFNAAGRGFIGGGGSLVEGIGDVAAIVPGLENNDFQQAGRTVKDFGSNSFPVNPANEGKFAVKAGEVIGGVAEQALEFATGAKVLGAIGQVGRAGQLAAASMFGKGADSGQDMAVQYGVDDDPWKKAAFTLGGGIVEAGTERLGGFAAESALARRLGVGGISGAPATGLSGYTGAVAMEGAEEIAANTANNTLTNILVSPDEAAAAGQRRPGYFEGNLEAGALGAIGGGVMALPLLGATPAAPLPPPAEFTTPPGAPPPVVAPTGRASVVTPATPAVGPAPITEEELAGWESQPSDNLSQVISPPSPEPVPPKRVAIVAGAIATSPTPAVEAEVIQTAQIAAALNAQKTSQSPETPPAATEALPLPVVPGEPPAPEADPLAVTASPDLLGTASGAETRSNTDINQPIAQNNAPPPEPLAEYQAPDQEPYSRPLSIDPPAVPLVPEVVAARLQARALPPAAVSVVNDPALPWEARLTPAGTIEVNAARMATPEDVDRVVDHEAAHLAEQDLVTASEAVAIRAAIAPETVAELENDLRSRGYDSAALPMEVAASLAERLNTEFQQAPAWKRFVQRIKTWTKERLGMSLNDKDASVIAARIIARGLKIARSGQAKAREGEALSLPSAAAPVEGQAPAPTALKKRPIFELFFGNNKRIVAETKDFEGRNAGRAALSNLLFDGIVPDYKPGAPFEEIIGTLTPEQRNTLHDRVLENLFRMTGTKVDAAAYGQELKAYLQTVPELDGRRHISMAGLQYSNLVQVAGILSGIYGQTAAFSTIIHTDNDQIQIGLDTDTILRSDLGRLLGSQAGIGARLAEFAAIIAKYNNAGLERLGLTDQQIKILAESIANKQLSAEEVEAIYAESTTSPKNASLIDTAIAKLQRLVDAAATQSKPKPAKASTGGKGQSLDEYAESLAESLLTETAAKLPPNVRQRLRKAVMEWIRGNQPESALADILGSFGISGEPANALAAAAVEKRALLAAEREARRIIREKQKEAEAAGKKAFTDMEREDAEKESRDAFIRKLLERFEDKNRVTKTDPGVMAGRAVIAQEARIAFDDYIKGGIPESKLTEVFSRLLTPKGVADFILSAQVAKQRHDSKEASKAFWKDAINLKPVRLADSILSDSVGPLVAKLPVNQIVKAFMAAPPHHRNSAAWRELQINRWLAEQGIDSELAARLSRSMDEMIAAVMANVIYQEQERFITNKKGIGDAAIANSEFRRKFEQSPDAVLEAIRKGLLNDGAPWQAWFSSVTGIEPLSAQVIADIGRLESIISSDRYLTPEKGVASAKLRDLMDSHFGKDPSLWELLAASYDASALSSGTTMGIQFSGPLGRLVGTFSADLIEAIASPKNRAGDIIDSLIASIDVYAAELPLAWKYDTAGTTMGNADLELAKVAALRKDLQKYGAVLLNKNASPAARVAVIPRVLVASQDFLRQAMNAADSAALAGFTRYFETREVRRILRRKGITKAQVQSNMERSGFLRDKLELQADALGYDGALKRRYIQDVLWEHEKSVSKAQTDVPAAHAAHMKELAANSKDEAENQIFIGEKRDNPGVTDPVDWALSGLQQIGQAAFRNARERVEAGQTAEGSLQRIATRALFGFVGIPLNAARASIWYSPLAAISWANYLTRKALYPDGNPYARSLGNEIAVRQRIKEGLVGNTILLLGVALAQGLGGDDEEKWQVNGYGPDPSRYPDEAKAWQRRHTAFAIERLGKDGKTETFKFDKGPLEYLKAPLMLLGGSNDVRLNSKLAKEPEPATKDLVIGGIRQLGLSSLTTGMRNVAGFREGLQQMGQDNSLDKAGSAAGFMVTPLMPYSGAERWIHTWNNPELLERTFKNNLPFAHYRDDARPALNSFGQNLRPDPSPTEAASRQTNGLLPGYSRTLTEEDNRLHGWIERTGIQPATPARSSLEGKLEQPVSDAQWWEYTKAAGKVRYDETLAAIDGTRQIERTIPVTGKDIKRMEPMKKGLADLDLADKEAVKQATAILKDISAEAHQAGLKAIGMKEPEKEKPDKKKAVPIY